MGGGGKRQSGSSCALLGEGEHAGDLHIEEREYAYLRATGESATMDSRVCWRQLQAISVQNLEQNLDKGCAGDSLKGR
jgi:hypothetical protein